MMNEKESSVEVGASERARAGGLVLCRVRLCPLPPPNPHFIYWLWPQQRALGSQASAQAGGHHEGVAQHFGGVQTKKWKKRDGAESHFLFSFGGGGSAHAHTHTHTHAPNACLPHPNPSP